jgi:hypothetical protein
MSGDLENAVQMLAADNARMCDILIAADKLTAEVAKLLESTERESAYSVMQWRAKLVRAALDNYSQTRTGQ